MGMDYIEKKLLVEMSWWPVSLQRCPVLALVNFTRQAAEVCIPKSSMYVLGRGALLCLISRSEKPVVC